MKPTQSMHLLSYEYSIDKHMAVVVYYYTDLNLLNRSSMKDPKQRENVRYDLDKRSASRAA